MLKTIFKISTALVMMAAPVGAQPQIALPPDEPKPAITRPPELQLQRETPVEAALAAPTPGANTAIGGYGEIVLNAPVEGERGTVVDVRRLVLYVGHNFTESLRVYTELEIEHAVSSATDQGEVEVEQAFVDYLVRRWVNLRAGLVIMPVGIINVYHEPPTFLGADRPETDTRIIPSTWREVGGGLFGAFGPLRYQLYVVTAFAASKDGAPGFDSEGLREGHQEGQLARAHDWGGVLRLDLTPWAPLTIGASGYYSHNAQGDQALGTAPVGIVEGDVRFEWKGMHARAEYANVWIGDADKISAANSTSVASQLRGGYIELGYNVLHPFKTRFDSSLIAFGRYERTDTQAELPPGVPRAPDKDRQVMTFGLSFRPIAEVALKVDYQRFWVDAGLPSADSWDQVNAALAWMF
jgi:hypothetical protein